MRLFKRLLKNNIIIALFNPGFWISFATGVLLSISQYIKESFSVRHYLEVYKKVWPSMLVPHTVFTKWIGGEAFSFQYFSFFILVPLLSTLPAGNAISLECKTRYRTIVMARAGKSAYFFSKLCAAFILGGLLSVFPLLLNLYLTAMTLPSIIPNNATGFFAISSESFMAEIFYTRPYQYIFIYLLFIFTFLI
jgi:hypothetical protein